jgi:hypothetical protein
MEYLKTLRWFEPFGGWNVHDTGFCNRILHWEIAYEINKHNNFQYKILLPKTDWPELEFISLPYTTAFAYYGFYERGVPNSKKAIDLRFKTVFDVHADNVRLASRINTDFITEMFKTKNFDLNHHNRRFNLNNTISNETHFYSNFGYNDLQGLYNYEIKDRPLSNIILNHGYVSDFIDRKTKDVVGIHLRRGYGIPYTDEDIQSLPESIRQEYIRVRRKFVSPSGNNSYKFIRDDVYFNIIDKIIELKPKQKIYISSDLPLNLIDYYVDRYPNNVMTRNAYISVINDYLYGIGIDVGDFKYRYIIENIIDLFVLSSCGFIITCAPSTWSEFAKNYKNAVSSDITEDWESEIKKKYQYYCILNETKNSNVDNKNINTPSPPPNKLF